MSFVLFSAIWAGVPDARRVGRLLRDLRRGASTQSILRVGALCDMEGCDGRICCNFAYSPRGVANYLVHDPDP